MSAGDIADTHNSVDNTVVCFDGLDVIVISIDEVEDAIDEVIWCDLTKSSRLVIRCSIADGVADGVFDGGFGWYGFKVGWFIEVECDFYVDTIGGMGGSRGTLSRWLVEGYSTEGTSCAGAKPLE